MIHKIVRFFWNCRNNRIMPLTSTNLVHLVFLRLPLRASHGPE
jgi:hypothetical protein